MPEGNVAEIDNLGLIEDHIIKLIVTKHYLLIKITMHI